MYDIENQDGCALHFRQSASGWVALAVTRQGSGKEVTLPSPPPLRTARESSPLCSSSLANALGRTRFLDGLALAVNLLVAMWVE